MSSSRFDGICKRDHDNKDISDFYQYFRANGKPYLRCKKCAKEENKIRKRQGVAAAKLEKSIELRVKENILAQHEELTHKLETAMPWEKDAIRQEIKVLLGDSKCL